MSFRSTFLVVVAVCVLLLTGAADEKTLISVDKAPNGLAPGIASLVNPKGFRVQSAEGPVCDVWLLKNVALKPGFKQTLNVKYPFQTGELVGVLRVGDKVEFSDFRGQPVKPGVYTLRYGQQPQDGNHIGTSDVYDFLVALPAATDTDPKLFVPPDRLHKASSKSVGTNHPAILSLLAVEAPIAAATLTKEENDRWVLGVPVQGDDNGKKAALSLRVVVVGKVAG
ncbi:MAG TPA: hypothetical protein VG055_28185 [Planctomycetaceae bacterium]|jgi:hypothetical protein|nr:hypothetical protein [Planctomycetaceae bacterium]